MNDAHFSFNRTIDLLYGLSYCVNRDNNTLKPYHPAENTPIVNDFYSLYKKQCDVSKNEILALGDYQKIAQTALAEHRIHSEALEQYLSGLSNIEQQVINDFNKKPGLNELDFSTVKSFFGFNLANEIKIYLSFFISGGFGFIQNNQSIIILGIKYDHAKNQYGANGTLVCKLIHEFSHPYVAEALKNNNLDIIIKDEMSNYYSDNPLEETLTRVVEIFFSTKIHCLRLSNFSFIIKI